MKAERNTPLPADFRLAHFARLEGDLLVGGDPFQLVRLKPSSLTRIRAWMDGASVGEDGVLARALVMANLAQPIPPPLRAPVSVVIPNHGRDLARLRAALDVDEVIVVDGLTAAAARNRGLGQARNAIVALLDSDTVPRPGWLAPLLAHFNDPAVDVVAPRIVPLGSEGRIGRYEARRSPLDRGPDPARVVPRGRVPFVPGAALLVRRHLRFDEAFDRGGEDVDFIRRANHVRYEPGSQVAHEHRTDPGQWLQRRVYYGRTAAPLALRHPNHARPLHVSVWTTATWATLAARRPATAAAITATATALLAREVPPRLAFELAALGTLRSGRVVADSLARAWWPVSTLAALRPRARGAARARRPGLEPGQPAQARRRPRVRLRRVAWLPDAPDARAARFPPGRGNWRAASFKQYCVGFGRRKDEMDRHRGLADRWLPWRSRSSRSCRRSPLTRATPSRTTRPSRSRSTTRSSGRSPAAARRPR